MAESRSFPNIPVSHWNNLRVQFKKSIPGAITSNYLASVLGMSENSAKTNIFPTLKQIGMVDDEGKTNQDFARKFRDDTAYPELCKEIISNIYPQELIDAFPEKEPDKPKVLSWFMNHTGVGSNAGQKMLSFYITLKDANPNIQVKTNANKPKENNGKKSPISIKNPEKKEAEPLNKAKEESIDGNGPKRTFPSINLNMQIHISADASPDQIKSIFENMAKYLYKD